MFVIGKGSSDKIAAREKKQQACFLTGSLQLQGSQTGQQQGPREWLAKAGPGQEALVMKGTGVSRFSPCLCVPCFICPCSQPSASVKVNRWLLLAEFPSGLGLLALICFSFALPSISPAP